MAFHNLPLSGPGIQLLQRSLARKRIGHAYLFSGDNLEDLESLAKTLAKTLNCQHPAITQGSPTDSCDACSICRKIDGEIQPDVHWVRPESKSRIITVEQMRSLTQQINLKPAEAEYKIAIIAGADRLNLQAANAFLKTLEEPPAKSIFILLSTEPSRILETILSRCLRLNFPGNINAVLGSEESAWLEKFSTLAVAENTSLMERYQMLDLLLQKLAAIRTETGEILTAKSPLEKHDDLEKNLREKWEDELAAVIEAEYRRHRSGLLLSVQWWLRDIWLHTVGAGQNLFRFKNVPGAEMISRRITSTDALENLRTLDQTQRLLHSNVQEALALEVALLKLHF